MVDYGDARSTQRPTTQWSEEVSVAIQHSPACKPNVAWYCSKQLRILLSCLNYIFRLESPAVKIMSLCGYDCRSFFQAVERLASQRNPAFANNCFSIPIPRLSPDSLLKSMAEPSKRGKAYAEQIAAKPDQTRITQFFTQPPKK